MQQILIRQAYNGLIGSETLTLTGQGSVTNKNVAGGTQAVTLGTLAIGNQSGATLQVVD